MNSTMFFPVGTPMSYAGVPNTVQPFPGTPMSYAGAPNTVQPFTQLIPVTSALPMPVGPLNPMFQFQDGTPMSYAGAPNTVQPFTQLIPGALPMPVGPLNPMFQSQDDPIQSDHEDEYDFPVLPQTPKVIPPNNCIRMFQMNPLDQGAPLNNDWAIPLMPELSSAYFIQLTTCLMKDYAAGVQVYPPKHLIFNAFNKTPLSSVKVVIVGQDPYHNGLAVGMSFSVPDRAPLSKSLNNIFDELVKDPGVTNVIHKPNNGNLEKWAERGVLLLNSTLTVEAGKPNSHKNYGWIHFTDSVIKLINDTCTGVVFVFWGKFAQKKEKLVTTPKHAVVKRRHPVLWSRGNIGGGNCFSEINQNLKRFYGYGYEFDWTV